MNHGSELTQFIVDDRTLRVLVVDGTYAIRSEIRSRLECEEIDVVEAGSGRDALEFIYSELPDLVLLDMAMADMDGLAVLKTLRLSYSKLQLPIILFSSRDTPEGILQALDFGANDCITKPINYDLLWARTSNQLMQKIASDYYHASQEKLERQVKQKTSELHYSNQKLEIEIQERIIAEDRLMKVSNYDSLTGLPNRALAMEYLEKTLVKVKGTTLKPCIAFLDIDNFKYVNDTLGHACGDKLLREVTSRLSLCVLETDTLARLGGDDFLLILDDFDGGSYHSREIGLRLVSESIIESFSKPFQIDGQEIIVSPSMGFAIYPKDGQDGSTLMRNADAAMYRAKNDGKNTYCFYTPEMTEKAKMRINIESQLRYAQERGELSLNYQPIVDATSGKIMKAEALLRWSNSELGRVDPEYFISIAEETGLIVPIGEYVIRVACQQIKKWRNSGWGDMCVTVNVSSRQFRPDSNLTDCIEKALKANSLPGDALQLELTEGILMRESDATDETMKTLNDMGIKLLIDDFGTGYASLSYLQRYPFVSLKIDRSYINNVLTSEQDAKLVKAVISMANSLDITVVSEGVETKEQLEFLLDANCKYAQGYYFSRPVKADDFDNLLEKYNERSSNVRTLKLAINDKNK